MDKLYIGADALLADSYKLAHAVLCSGYEPNFLIGVWRGGAPVAVAVHEYLRYKGLVIEHAPICASSYQGIDQQTKNVRLHSMDYVFNTINSDSKILLVDDIFDTGKSMAAVIAALQKNRPGLDVTNLRIATPWYKPTRNTTNIVPDYFLHSTSQWLVFPHELCGLSPDEIIQSKGLSAATQTLFTQKP